MFYHRQDSRVVFGGGAAETSCSLHTATLADQQKGLRQHSFRAFSDALEAIPLALAENSGLSPIDVLSELKTRQIAEKNPALGVDCMNNGQYFLKLNQTAEVNLKNVLILNGDLV